MAPSDRTLTRWFNEHRSFLWGLCYRVTGSAADADDVVQETFIRALNHAPETLAEPRRWLVRVAVNAARDALRRRKRRSYQGTWLPAPIETGGDGNSAPVPYQPAVDEGRTPEKRYDLMESVSLAFLQSLEVLTPTQRAVLLLADVFDYSTAEVRAALDLSEGNVRVVHHRARRAMAAYDRNRTVPTPANRRRTAAALERFLQLLGDGDVKGIEQMLAADVRMVADGGGEFTATLRPVIGRLRVAQLFARLRASRSGDAHLRCLDLNGFPAAIFEFNNPMGRRPPRLALSVCLNRDGLISRVWAVVSSRKLPPALAVRSSPTASPLSARLA
jgi:RNA polymerase sigma factor (sigma-70 family)